MGWKPVFYASRMSGELPLAKELAEAAMGKTGTSLNTSERLSIGSNALPR